MKRKTFCQRFDEVASRYADRAAIEMDGRSVCTYAELADRSHQLAGAIQRRVLCRPSVVAIHLPKSIDYIASMIGIWRSGCVALPLPPEFPLERRREMLQRANASVVIAGEQGLKDHQQVFGAFHVITPGCDAGEVQLTKDLPPAEPRSSAYILFTSGSTGRPKGVVVSHRGLMPMLDAQIDVFQLDSTTRSLFYLSTAFDASISDIGTALMAGGTLVIDSDLSSLSVAELFSRINERRITYADLPPALMSHAARQCIEAPESLKTVVVGGELSPMHSIRWWAPRVRLINVYGPTEATVCTSVHVWNAGWQEHTSIGRPLPSVVFRVEPSDMRDPTEGELWIGGPCVARGYLDDPQLEKSKFVRNGVRWYRTGDRVRWNHDGQYHFLGRLDRQFKLRGRLVEPAEIEQLLMELPEIAVAVVLPIVRLDVDDQQTSQVSSIGCVLQPSDGACVDVTSVRRQLAQRLPEWMIPQHIRVVSHVVRTASGKVDHQSLSQLFAERDRLEQPLAPSSPCAESLRQSWMTALQTDSLGWDDDFFLVGGDSISAIQVLAQAKSNRIPVTLSMLYEKRTLRECLAAAESQNVGISTRELETRGDAIVRRCQFDLPSTDVADISRRPRHYLITGATGLLGTWLLDQLASQSDARIECLVRAGDRSHALSRIRDSRRRFLGIASKPSWHADLGVVCGDTRRDNWGLDRHQWDRLGEEVTDVVHLAAEVHLLKPFDTLRAANLDSVLPALQLCHHRRLKWLHFASTLSVFVASDRAETCFYEEDRLEQHATIFGGYGQTKWLAERVLWRSPRSCPMSVIRFGLLTGDSRSGAHVALDQLTRFTRGLAALGVYPDGCDRLRFDVTPVDFASSVQSHLINARTQGAFHVCGERAISFAEWIAAMDKAGVRLKCVSPLEFQSAVKDRLGAKDQGDAAAACLSLCRRLEPAEIGENHRDFDLFLATGIEFDTTRVNRALSETTAMTWDVDQSALVRMIKSMLAPRPAETSESVLV